jgi:hypothetical protein
LGTEIDYDFSSLKANNGTAFFNNGNAPVSDIDTSLNNFGTAPARIGYVFGPAAQWMAYGTGGAAFGRAVVTDNGAESFSLGPALEAGAYGENDDQRPGRQR